MDDAAVREIIRDVEATKGRQSAHERECTIRYTSIEKRLETGSAVMSKIADDVAALRQQGNHAAWSANWKAWAVAVFIGGILLSALTWTASQLYALQPLRMQQAAAAHAAKTTP